MQVDGVDMSGRHWRLPSEVPVNLDSDAPMTAEELASRDSGAASSPFPGSATKVGNKMSVKQAP